MEVEEPFQQSKNPRRARRRDLNAMTVALKLASISSGVMMKVLFQDPTMESDGEDVGVPEVGMVFNNHTEVNRFYRKASWVPVFIKDTFWAGMSVTQRNETITPFFDGYVDIKTTLKQFLGKYEMALQSKYEKEAQADFETFHKQRPPVSKFYMEEQLSKVYTHNMFKKFQDEIEAIMYCHVSLIVVDGSVSTFNVKECIFLEDATDNGNGGPKGPEAHPVMQASQIQKGGAERGVIPAGYIGVPANFQQFVPNQAAIQPSIVYMVPTNVDPHAFGNGVLMPVMYQQMFQVPQKPNGTVQDTSANGKKKRPRGQKLTETSQLSNGTPGPSSG
nr:unnamed protein product [Digitaria exilis]